MRSLVVDHIYLHIVDHIYLHIQTAANNPVKIHPNI